MKKILPLFPALMCAVLTGCQSGSRHLAEGSLGPTFQTGTGQGFAPAGVTDDGFMLPDAFSVGDLRHANRATREGRIIPN